MLRIKPKNSAITPESPLPATNWRLEWTPMSSACGSIEVEDHFEPASRLPDYHWRGHCNAVSLDPWHMIEMFDAIKEYQEAAASHGICVLDESRNLGLRRFTI